MQHTGHNLDLSNAVGVTEDDTNLGGGCALLGELADLVDDLLGGGLEPRGRGARVGDRRGGDTLSIAVKTTHCGGWWCGVVERMSSSSSVVGRLEKFEGDGGL